MAEAVRRIRLAAETGADTLDFCDLTAMQRLPEELALVPGRWPTQRPLLVTTL